MSFLNVAFLRFRPQKKKSRSFSSLFLLAEQSIYAEWTEAIFETRKNIESELALDLETTKVKSISADAIHNNIEDEQ